MTKKAETDYTVKVNGMPNYANIPKAVLEPIVKKFLENILREQQERKETEIYGRCKKRLRQTCRSHR